MVTVNGWVSYEGVPIESGTILFESDDNEHRAYSAPIENGLFTMQVEPGPKTVQVTAHREIPGKFEEIPGPEGAPPVRWPATEMYIPEKFNVLTELRYTVTDDGADDVEFSLRP